MNKTLFYFFCICSSLLGFSIAQASDSNPKDNVLIYANKNGSSRGYDLLWKAPNITGTYAQEANILRKGNVVYSTSLSMPTQPGNNKLFALDALTGHIIAEYLVGPSFGAVHIEGNTLYVGTASEPWDLPDWSGAYGLYSFDISNISTTGFVLNWFKNVPTGVASPNLIIDGNNLFFSEFTGNKVFAINKITGNDVWSFTKDQYMATIPVLVGDYLYIPNSYASSALLYKINKNDGSLVWQKPIIGLMWDNSITYSADTNSLLLTTYYDSQKRAASYDLDGNLLWGTPLNCESLSYTGYHNSSVFFSDLCGWVYSLNATTGTIEWSTQVGKGIHKQTDIASPVIANGLVFIGTKGDGYNLLDSRGRGGLYALDEETGAIVWKYEENDLGDIMSLATVAGGVLYNATNAWDVFAFDVGDATSTDHLIPSYAKENTLATTTGLTQNKFAGLTCGTVMSTSTCILENKYTGKLIETKIQFTGDPIESVSLPDGSIHMYVEGNSFYSPSIEPLQSNSLIIKTNASGYSNLFPRLSNPTLEAKILGATYAPISNGVSLTVDYSGMFATDIINFSYPFLNTPTIITNTTASFSKILSGGTYINSVPLKVNSPIQPIEIYVDTWNESMKRFTEKTTTLGSNVEYLFEKLLPNQPYILKDGAHNQTIQSNHLGIISYSKNLLVLENTIELILPNPVNNSSGGILPGYTINNSGSESKQETITPLQKSGNMCTPFTKTISIFNKKNDTLEIARWQEYLKQYEKESLSITGLYDIQTIAAVKRFQNKYKFEILTPWNLKKPTGLIYTSTRKYANKTLKCSL